MLVVFDLDGTLCDLTHRLHYIQTHPKNYDAFQKGCWKDSPIHEILHVCGLFINDGYSDVVFCSGRSNDVRSDTIEWLCKYLSKATEDWEEMFLGSPADARAWVEERLYMRKSKDYRKDSVVKAELLDEIKEDHGRVPSLVFDDRSQVVDMWREKGIRVCQVAKGDF